MSFLFVGFSASAQDAEYGNTPEISLGDSIPLDTEDATIDLWKTPRDDLLKGREPGPVNVQRFSGGAGFQGVPTFFKQPIALTPEDLVAGDVDVAIIGAYTDMGGGTRGAAWGPMAFRAVRAPMAWGVMRGDNLHTMINPFEVLNIVDYGDAPNDLQSIHRTMVGVREFVAETASVKNQRGENVIPIIIGGDHSLMYSDAAGLADVYGKGNVGIVHFDAHYDAGKQVFGHMISHSQPVYRLIREGHVPGKNFVQVGLRGYYPTKESFEWMREQEFRYHTLAEIGERGWGPVMDDILREANDGPENIFISFDVDVFDPAHAPATGTPEPGGLTPREVFPLIRRLCAESNVVGFELVELAPTLEGGAASTLAAERVVRECLVGIALRKEGIDEENYLSPLAVDDGRR